MHTGSNPSPLRRRKRAVTALASMLPLILLAALLVTTPGTAGAGEGLESDLSVTMVDDPDPVAPGAVVTFSIRVTNLGPDDASNVTAEFFTDGDGIAAEPRLFNDDEGDDCSTEGNFVSCNLGTIEAENFSAEAFDPELDPNEKGIEIDVFAPETEPGGDFAALASFTFSSGVSVWSDNFDPDDTFDSDAQTTTVSEGDSDSGTIDPGESLSTVPGTNANPVTTGDPFAVSLENVSNQTLEGSVSEEACDGSQEGDPLCSVPRVGGVAGDFQFTPTGPALTTTTTSGGSLLPAVAVARLFYDKTVLQGVDGFKIFFQKDSESPVLKLQRCKAGVRRTECFKTNKKKSGDQIVRVFLNEDPRVTRG